MSFAITTPAPPMAALTTKSRREIFPDLFSKCDLRLIPSLTMSDPLTAVLKHSSRYSTFS
jgi:hypothetical protein